MRTRGSSTSERRVVLVEERPAPKKTSVELPTSSPQDWGKDINPPDLEKPLLRFGPTLVAEKSDRHNWTLKERKKLNQGPNAGLYRWNDLGYFGTPGQAYTKALRLEMEGKLVGQGLTSLQSFVGALQGLEFEKRDELQRVIFEDAIRKAAEVVENEEGRKAVLALLGGSRQ